MVKQFEYLSPLDGVVASPRQPVGEHLALALHVHESPLLHRVAAELQQRQATLRTDVNFERQTVGLHARRRVHSVTKQTVPRHREAHHSCHHWTCKSQTD